MSGTSRGHACCASGSGSSHWALSSWRRHRRRWRRRPVGKEKVASILTWTQKQQLERYPAIEKVYQVATIKKGDKVHELPAGQPIDPKITIRGKTQDFDAFMKQWRISGVIVVKDGKVVMEKYGMGRTPDQRWTSFSVAKSMTSTLIGAAMKDRYIRSIYDPITRYIPELEGSAYDGVSLRQVMTMTSGVKWSEDYADPKSDVSLSGTQPYNGRINPLIEYMSKLKRDAPAGSKFVYNTGETDLAGIALSRALAGKSIADYASEKIWAPFGMEQDGLWMVDKAGHERGGCCMSMTLRDYARVGLFMLGGGKAGGKDVLPAGWVEEATTNQAPRGRPRPLWLFLVAGRSAELSGARHLRPGHRHLSRRKPRDRDELGHGEGDRPETVGSHPCHDRGDSRGGRRVGLTRWRDRSPN